MKKSRIILLLFTAILFAVACTPKEFPVIGFDTDLSEEDRGITMMHVGSNTGSVTLHGEIYLSGGKMNLEFESPDGQIVYNKVVEGPARIYVNEITPSMRGLYKLRYTCKNGEGYINLKMFR
ncbi:MAG TPA: hypothetical protein VJ946_07940 [Bacteroidales bacterium]|nr:hypothetical protein [Bacteroidales bacterium]